MTTYRRIAEAIREQIKDQSMPRQVRLGLLAIAARAQAQGAAGTGPTIALSVRLGMETIEWIDEFVADDPHDSRHAFMRRAIEDRVLELQEPLDEQ